MSFKRASLAVIFTTVFIDLVGFGMIIPLVGIYGRHYGASGLDLAILGSVYSLMQFLFARFWGRLSDRYGRRPILLMSLAGSVITYLWFAVAGSVGSLILSRALGGLFAANISTAQAYIADITSEKDRAKGMGLLGAAFGIGFTIGPPIGGIAGARIGLWAPGVIAASLCFLNLILAYFRLKESLPTELREKARSTRVDKTLSPKLIRQLKQTTAFLPILIFFVATYAFSNLEQVFSLFLQTHFDLLIEEAAYKTGLVLMWSGLLGAIIQGGLIRKLVPKYGEKRLVYVGLLVQAAAMIGFSFAPTYGSLFILAIPLAVGSGLLNPSLNAWISKSAPAERQGEVMGLSQGFSSLARILGPFSGLSLFALNIQYPFFWGAAALILIWFYARPVIRIRA
jgi:MFS transporter, DHA1 family, tetracycline resistance protein